MSRGIGCRLKRSRVALQPVNHYVRTINRQEKSPDNSMAKLYIELKQLQIEGEIVQ